MPTCYERLNSKLKAFSTDSRVVHSPHKILYSIRFTLHHRVRIGKECNNRDAPIT